MSVNSVILSRKFSSNHGQGRRLRLELPQCPLPGKEELFLVLGLFLSGKISMNKAEELLN